ncbi:MAG: tetratricopeptide repeat protein, partial [Nannocystaceae bacterium]|nr:tetratricopeptide repeat protein [Nannocystaceae bacterium]
LALRGDALVGAGRAREAIAELERARELLTALYDARGAELGIVESNLGAAYSALDEPERASVHQGRALALLEAAYGPEHPDLAFPLLAIAQALGARGRHDEALPSLRRAAALAPPQARPFAQARLAAGLVAVGRIDEGLDTFARARAGLGEVDIDPVLVGDVEESFANALWSAQRTTEARAAAMRAHEAFVDADQPARAEAIARWLAQHPEAASITRSPPAPSRTPPRR